MKYLPLFASIELSENDRRLLVVLIVFLFVFFIIAGAIGFAIRKTMEFQAKRVNEMCTKVLTTRVVYDDKTYKRYANAKSSILYFKQSIIGVLLGFIGLIIWLICSGIFGTWAENPFYHFVNDLFFIFGVNSSSQTWDFLNITFHTLVVINNDGAGPKFVIEHIPFYIETILFVVSACWILVATQAFVSRYFAIKKFAKDAADRQLKDFTFPTGPNAAQPQQNTNSTLPPQQ